MRALAPLALAALLWSPLLVVACIRERVVERPKLLAPPPCLARLAPTAPPAYASRATWTAYHVSLEAWAAEVERSCGAHLLPEGATP